MAVQKDSITKRVNSHSARSNRRPSVLGAAVQLVGRCPMGELEEERMKGKYDSTGLNGVVGHVPAISAKNPFLKGYAKILFLCRNCV